MHSKNILSQCQRLDRPTSYPRVSSHSMMSELPLLPQCSIFRYGPNVSRFIFLPTHWLSVKCTARHRLLIRRFPTMRLRRASSGSTYRSNTAKQLCARRHAERSATDGGEISHSDSEYDIALRSVDFVIYRFQPAAAFRAAFAAFPYLKTLTGCV